MGPDRSMCAGFKIRSSVAASRHMTTDTTAPHQATFKLGWTKISVPWVN